MAMNMDYCKFENTLAALEECSDEIHTEADETTGRSEYEERARIKLIELCKRIAGEN